MCIAALACFWTLPMMRSRTRYSIVPAKRMVVIHSTQKMSLSFVICSLERQRILLILGHTLEYSSQLAFFYVNRTKFFRYESSIFMQTVQLLETKFKGLCLQLWGKWTEIWHTIGWVDNEYPELSPVWHLLTYLHFSKIRLGTHILPPWEH